jgi:hypothetical protein
MTTEKKGNGKGKGKVAEAAPAVKKVASMAHGEIQTKDNPPKVAKGMKAIWHEPCSYKAPNGTLRTVRGHWEVANEPEPKKVEPTK